MRLKCDLVVYLKCLLQIIHLYDDERLHFLFFFCISSKTYSKKKCLILCMVFTALKFLIPIRKQNEITLLTFT